MNLTVMTFKIERLTLGTHFLLFSIFLFLFETRHHEVLSILK